MQSPQRKNFWLWQLEHLQYTPFEVMSNISPILLIQLEQNLASGSQLVAILSCELIRTLNLKLRDNVSAMGGWR